MGLSNGRVPTYSGCMVTLPDTPHDRRDIAEGFGGDAERYDRVRPRYPSELATVLLDGLRGRGVLDVGVGTGISALPFLDAGCTVLGVDVDDRMAEFARARGIDVELARFEEWDAAGRMFDLVISGQSWHWVDPDRGAERAASVLRAGGRIALFWNAGDPPPDIAAGFADAYRSIDTGLPFTPFASGQTAADGYARFTEGARAALLATHAFDEPRPLHITWEQHVTRDAWLDLVPSSGGHGRIPRAALARLLDAMGRVVDDAGGAFTMTYTTVGHLAERR